MHKEDCYFLGIISKRHGYKGSVILKIDTDQPETYNNLESVFLLQDGMLIPFFIQKCIVSSTNSLILTFEDVSNEQINNLIGKEAFLPLNTLPKLTGNQFYYHEVIGFDMIDEDYGKVGTIKSINDNGAQPLFEIKGPFDREVIIPLIKDWLLEVNKTDKYIKITTPAGLIQLFLD